MRWVGYGFIHLSNFKTDVYIVLGPFCGEYYYCIYLYVWLKWEHCWSIFRLVNPVQLLIRGSAINLLRLVFSAFIGRLTSLRRHLIGLRLIGLWSNSLSRSDVELRSLYLDCERCRVEKKHKARCKSSWE